VLASRAVRGAPRLSVGFLVCCVPLGALAGCGGGARQDAGQDSGSYQVKVVSASFPADQSISSAAPMQIVVRNDGKQTVPDLTIALQGISDRNDQAALADQAQPVWIVQDQPGNATTAYDFTWSLGPLKVGETKRLALKLMPAVPGTHTVKWAIDAGLTGKFSARTASGRVPAGTFTVRVSTEPAPATVDPDTGAVVRGT
jgi:hypothetical protein